MHSWGKWSKQTLCIYAPCKTPLHIYLRMFIHSLTPRKDRRGQWTIKKHILPSVCSASECFIRWTWRLSSPSLGERCREGNTQFLQCETDLDNWTQLHFKPGQCMIWARAIEGNRNDLAPEGHIESICAKWCPILPRGRERVCYYGKRSLWI